MDLAGLAKIQRQWMPNDGLLTLGISSRNVGDSTNQLRGNISVDMAHKDWGGARALGLPITMHTSGLSPVTLLEKAGLLGPDVQLVHPLLTTPEERKILAKRGVSYSMSPVGESQRPAAAGVIQLGELLEAGVKVSMSIDLTGTYTVDFFQCMRVFRLPQNAWCNWPRWMARWTSISLIAPVRSHRASAPTSFWCAPPTSTWRYSPIRMKHWSTLRSRVTSIP